MTFRGTKRRPVGPAQPPDPLLYCSLSIRRRVDAALRRPVMSTVRHGKPVQQLLRRENNGKGQEEPATVHYDEVTALRSYVKQQDRSILLLGMEHPVKI
jgi:hypothetical protein